MLPADATDPDAAELVVAAVEQEWGNVEVLVLNAGAAGSAPLVRTTDAEWQRLLEINLTAPFRLLRRVVPGMVAQGFGRIVAIASMAAKRGDPYSAPTPPASRLLGLVRSAARSWPRPASR